MARLRAKVEDSPLKRRPVADPVHLCHLVPQMDVGGMASTVLEVCNGLETDDFMTSVLCINGRGLAAERVEPRVQVWALHGNEREAPGAEEVVLMADLFKRYAVDLLHIHGAGWYYPAGALAARLASVGHLLLTEHDVGRAPLESPWRLGVTQALKWTDRFAATSPAVAGSLAGSLGLDPDRVQVIPKGIDLERYRAPEDDESAEPKSAEVVIGAAGPLNRGAGHAVLLEAAATLREDGVPLRLVLLGRGPERERLLKQVHQLDLQRCVTAVRTMADMPAFFAGLDIFVVPGRHAGVSSAALEAMAAGLPVVAANAGANMEAVRDGETGMLVPEGNAAVLARILAQLAGEPERRQALGEQARRHAEEHHRVETMVQRHSALYHSLGWIQKKEEPS